MIYSEVGYNKDLETLAEVVKYTKYLLLKQREIDIIYLYIKGNC